MATNVSTGGDIAPAEVSARAAPTASTRAGANAGRRHSFSGALFPPPATPAAAEAQAAAEAAAAEMLSRLPQARLHAGAARPPFAATPSTDAAARLSELEMQMRIEAFRLEAKRLEHDLAFRPRPLSSTSATTGAPSAAPYRTPAAASLDGGGGGDGGGGHSGAALYVSPDANTGDGGHGADRPMARAAWAGAFATPALLPTSARKAVPLRELVVQHTIQLKPPPQAPQLDDPKYRKDIDGLKAPALKWLDQLSAWDRANVGTRDTLNVHLSDLLIERGLHNNPQLMAILGVHRYAEAVDEDVLLDKLREFCKPSLPPCMHLKTVKLERAPAQDSASRKQFVGGLVDQLGSVLEAYPSPRFENISFSNMLDSLSGENDPELHSNLKAGFKEMLGKYYKNTGRDNIDEALRMIFGIAAGSIRTTPSGDEIKPDMLDATFRGRGSSGGGKQQQQQSPTKSSPSGGGGGGNGKAPMCPLHPGLSNHSLGTCKAMLKATQAGEQCPVPGHSRHLAAECRNFLRESEKLDSDSDSDSGGSSGGGGGDKTGGKTGAEPAKTGKKTGTEGKDCSCYNCGLPGHMARDCTSRATAAVRAIIARSEQLGAGLGGATDDDDDDGGEDRIRAVRIEGNPKNRDYTLTAFAAGATVDMDIDTGATHSVFPLHLFEALPSRPELQLSKTALPRLVDFAGRPTPQTALHGWLDLPVTMRARANRPNKEPVSLHGTPTIRFMVVDGADSVLLGQNALHDRESVVCKLHYLMAVKADITYETARAETPAASTLVATSATPSQKGAEKEEGPPAPAEPRHSLHQPLAPAEQAEPLEPLGPPVETSPPASEPATGAGLEPVTSGGLEPATTSHEPAAAAEEYGPELSRIFVQMPVDCGATMCSNLDCSSYGRAGRCCGCYTTTYCSKNCQELHWPTHRDECQAEQRRSLAHDRELGLAQHTDPSGHVYYGRVVPDGSSPPDASMWLRPPIGMWRALEPEASPEPEPSNIEWARLPDSRTAIFDLIMSECALIRRDFADAAKPHFFDTGQPVSSLFIQEHDENRTAQHEHPRAFETVFALDPAEPVLIQTDASSTLSGATWANDAQWHSSAVFRPYQALHGEPWRPGGITIPTGISEPRFITGRL